jgi:hypothetical protein
VLDNLAREEEASDQGRAVLRQLALGAVMVAVALTFAVGNLIGAQGR